jgi:DNA-binding transcriptional ArsR family regulator
MSTQGGSNKDLDEVFKALADATRREILDYLRAGPRTTTEIVDQFPKLSRFGVMKHIDVLREASLVLVRRDGRRRINSLNAVPIRAISERWISKYEAFWANTLLRIKDDAEMPKLESAKPKRYRRST